MNLSELYKNNQKLNDLRQKLHDAYKSNDENAVTDTFLQMFQTSNWGLGAALSLVLLALVSALIWLLMRITRVNRLVG